MNSKIPFKPKEGLNWLAHLYYLRGEYENCEKVNSVIESDYSKYLIGLINLRTYGDIKKSLKFFNQIYSINDNLYCKAIAKCILLLGKHSQLISMLKKDYLKLFPSEWLLWMFLGIAQIFQSDISSAKDSFQHSLQTTNQIEPFLYLSHCHMMEGDVKSAIFVLRRATELAPDNIELNIKLGLLLYTNGMKSKGIDKLNQLMYISANTIGNLQMSLAVGSLIQETQEDVDGALYRYKLANNFESPVLWNNVSLCFSVKKKYVAAISCLKRSLYLNVFDWKLNYNLGLLNLQLKQYSSAFHYLKATVSMSGLNLPNVFSLLAICLQNLEDEKNTKYAHEKAVKRASDELLPIPIINYSVYLYNTDSIKNKEKIIELLMEFEQCYLKRKKNSEFDESVLYTASQLCIKLNVNHSFMSWNKDLVIANNNKEMPSTSNSTT